MKNNKWQALSLSERAFLIREAVRNGITDINSIRDTWEHRFDGESNNLSREDFYKQKQQEAIQAARLKQQSRTTHLSPIQAKTEEDKELDKDIVKRIQNRIQKRIEAELPSYSDYTRPTFQSFVKKYAQLQKRNSSRIDEDLEYYTERLKSAEEEASKCTKEGFGCIYQALDNYGKVETSNYNFMQFPEKYGFKSIPVEKILPGDLVQFTDDNGYPVHMLMAETPYNNTNENYEGEHMRYSGNAGHELRNNAKFQAPWDSLRAYTFVGNKADSLQWKKEYREKYGHQFSGEDNTQEKPWYKKVWDAISEGGRMARDARIGAIGAEQIRELYDQGESERAQELAKQYAKANIAGMAMAAGAANTAGLVGDLAITGVSTLADTAVEGNADNIVRDLGLNTVFDIVGHGAGKVSNLIKSGIKNTRYNISLEDALKSGMVPDDKKSFFEIMLRKRPEYAEKLWAREARRSPGPSIDRSKLYYNKEWYKSRLQNKGYSEAEIEKILQHYDTQLDLVDGVSFVDLPDEMLGRTTSFTVGDKKAQQIELSHRLKEDPTISKAMDDVLTHEAVHATSFTGYNLPAGVNNYSIVLTPNFKRDINPKLFDYHSNLDEQRVRLLSFADFAETKFGGDYEKAYQFVLDTQKNNWLSKDKTYINGDLTDLVRTFNREDVINGAKNVLSISPIIGMSPFILQNQSANKENSSHKFSGKDNQSPYIGTLSKKVTTKANSIENDDVDYGNFWKVLKNISTAEDAPPAPPKQDLHFEWLRPVDEAIAQGSGFLYDPLFYKKNKILRDKVYNTFYSLDDPDSDINIPEEYEILSKEQVRKLLPKRDYIGGKTPKETRDKVASLIPGLIDSLQAISSRHKINPELLHHRISKEGYYDKKASKYNYEIYKDEMPKYWSNVANQEVNGFSELGLDDAGELLEKGLIKVTRPISYETIDATNEKGRNVTSIITPNLWDALEIKAGDIKYRQEEMRKRGILAEDLDTWTNAAYNLGLYHNDLNNEEWLRKNYTLPSYENLFKK